MRYPCLFLILHTIVYTFEYQPMNSLRILMRSFSTGVEMTKQLMNANNAVR